MEAALTQGVVSQLNKAADNVEGGFVLQVMCDFWFDRCNVTAVLVGTLKTQFAILNMLKFEC